MSAKRRPPINRFIEKVDRSAECWLWTGAKDYDGYSIFQVEPKRSVRGHRWIYEQVVGPIPEGMHLCHHCDTPACVRPGHLFIGSALDNNRDRDSKGRGATGERHPRAVLTEDQVRSIRALSREGVRQRELARRLGCSRGAVEGVLRGTTWASVL